MKRPRRLLCSEADYLKTYGIEATTALQYPARFTPRQVVELHQAGITPEAASRAVENATSHELITWHQEANGV